MPDQKQETENERYQRVLREARAIAENPEETPERRAKAQFVVKELTRGTHVSPDVK